MKDPGQLLDSHDEPIEHIEKKWLVPLVLLILCFPYLFLMVNFTIPGRNFWEAGVYVPLVTNAFYLGGAILYDFLKQKKLVIYIGLLLLMTFCLWTSFVLLGQGYFNNEIHVYLLGAGAGFSFYPIASLFLRYSFPAGHKQQLLLLLLSFQFLFRDLIFIGEAQRLNPEETGIFPLLVCLVLFAIALVCFVAFPLRSSFIEPGVKEPSSKKFDWKSMVLLSFYYMAAAFAVHQSPDLFPTATLPSDMKIYWQYSEYFEFTRSLVPCLILLFFAARKIRCSYQHITRIGLLLLFLSFFLELFSHLLLSDVRLPVVFLFGIKMSLAAGLTLIILGMFSFLMQYSTHRYYASLLALPVFPLTTSFLPLLLPWMSFEENNIRQIIFYYSAAFALVLSVCFYLYLNRKNKPTPHERID